MRWLAWRFSTDTSGSKSSYSCRVLRIIFPLLATLVAPEMLARDRLRRGTLVTPEMLARDRLETEQTKNNNYDPYYKLAGEKG